MSAVPARLLIAFDAMSVWTLVKSVRWDTTLTKKLEHVNSAKLTIAEVALKTLPSVPHAKMVSD